MSCAVLVAKRFVAVTTSLRDSPASAGWRADKRNCWLPRVRAIRAKSPTWDRGHTATCHRHTSAGPKHHLRRNKGCTGSRRRIRAHRGHGTAHRTARARDTRSPHHRGPRPRTPQHSRTRPCNHAHRTGRSRPYRGTPFHRESRILGHRAYLRDIRKPSTRTVDSVHLHTGRATATPRFHRPQRGPLRS